MSRLENPYALPKDTPTLREKLRAVPFALRMDYEVDKVGFVALVVRGILRAPLASGGVIAVKGLTDAVVSGRASDVTFWLIVLLIIAGLTSLSSVFEEFIRAKRRHLLEIKMEKRLLEHLMHMPYSVLENPGFQALALAYSKKSYVIMNLSQWFMNGLDNVFALMGLSAVFVYLPLPAALILMASLFLRYILAGYEGKWSWSVFQHETREGRRAQYYAATLVSPTALLTAKGWGLHRPFMKLWTSFTDKLLAKKIEEARLMTRSMIAGEALQYIGLAVGLILTVRQHKTVGTLVAFITTYQQMLTMLSYFSWNARAWLRDSTILPVMQRFFSVPHERDESKPVPRGKLTIRFEDVVFRYPGSRQDVLKGVTLEIHEGEHIALVGLNGAGKTTLLKMLMKVYEPTHGRILVNGVDLHQIKPSAWRHALSIMGQNVPVYDDTMQNQVLYGDFSRAQDRDRLRLALAASGLKNLVKEMRYGLETHAGKVYSMPEDEAIELSGGQNQIVTIARTLYRNARVYIFDEPTSALDAEKEEKFFEALPKALAKQAVIFVSHRFSTVRRAERIIVLEHGRVIEEGTHEDLVALDGRYAGLFRLQAKMYR